MKKIISLITILSFLMQVVPFEVKAQPVYDDVFNSGDIFIAADGLEGGTTQMVRYDASNAYASSTLATFPANIFPGYSLFLPSGDLIIPAFHFNGAYPGGPFADPNVFRPYIFCKTAASDFASNCSWSGVNGYDLGATAVLSNSVPVTGNVDQYGQIWTVHHESTGDGQYVARTNLDSGTPVVTTYHMVPGSAPTTARPLGITFDHLGDVWITSYYNSSGPVIGNRIFCLDRSNNYAVCTGAAFAADGSISLGTATAPQDVVVDSNNDIFITLTGLNTYVGGLAKIDRDNNFTVSTLAFSASSPAHQLPDLLALDVRNPNDVTDDWLWVNFKTDDDTGGVVNIECRKAIDLTECLSGGASRFEYVDIGYYDPAFHSYDVGQIFVDKDRKVYSIQTNNGGTGRVYCWAPDDINTTTSYSACTGANFSSADADGARYLSVNNLGSPYGSNKGDVTATKIKVLMEIAAGQDTAQITATVDPVISVAFRTSADDGPLVDNLCALGNISDGTVKTCGYRIAIDTNATNGFSISADANGGLISGSDEIDAIAENSTVSANTEGYGIAVVKPADTAGTTFTEVGDFSDDDTPVPNAITQIVTSDGPVDWTAATLNTSTLITHRVAVSPITPAGSYSQIITYTVTGNF